MFRILTTAIVCLLALAASYGVAQDPPQPAGAAPEAATNAGQTQPAATSTTAPSVGNYPPYPLPFHRGNHPPNAESLSVPIRGWYLSLFKVSFFVFLLWFWVWSSQWVNNDSTALKVRKEHWNSLMMGAGGAGLLLALGKRCKVVLRFRIIRRIHSQLLTIGERRQRGYR